jgi:ribosomal protein L24E
VVIEIYIAAPGVGDIRRQRVSDSARKQLFFFDAAFRRWSNKSQRQESPVASALLPQPKKHKVSACDRSTVDKHLPRELEQANKAVGALIVRADGKVLLLQEKKCKNEWIQPGGTPNHVLLVARNCAHYVQSDARGEVLISHSAYLSPESHRPESPMTLEPPTLPLVIPRPSH